MLYRPAIIKSKLHVLQGILDTSQPIDLATTDGTSGSLSDAKWSSAQGGWGKVARNHFNLEQERRNSLYLALKGKFYEKGLYAHSASEYTLDLAKRWNTFTATVGLRDGAAKQGSAIFTVHGDGKELYKSKILRAGQSEELEVDLSGVSELKLKADGGEDHVHNSWAIWAKPILKR